MLLFYEAIVFSLIIDLYIPMVWIIFSKVILKNLVSSSIIYGVWLSAVSSAIEALGCKMLPKCKKIVYNLRLMQYDIGNHRAWSVNRNFLVSLKTDVSTEGKFWFTIFFKKMLKVICKKIKLICESQFSDR